MWNNRLTAGLLGGLLSLTAGLDLAAQTAPAAARRPPRPGSAAAAKKAAEIEVPSEALEPQTTPMFYEQAVRDLRTYLLEHRLPATLVEFREAMTAAKAAAPDQKSTLLTARGLNDALGQFNAARNYFEVEEVSRLPKSWYEAIGKRTDFLLTAMNELEVAVVSRNAERFGQIAATLRSEVEALTEQLAKRPKRLPDSYLEKVRQQNQSRRRALYIKMEQQRRLEEAKRAALAGGNNGAERTGKPANPAGGGR